MAAEYQQTWNMMTDPPSVSETTILRIADQAHIPCDGANRDYQEYLTWEAEPGNDIDPPPPLPEPPPPEPDANVRLDTGAQGAKAAWDANTISGRAEPGGMSTEERLVRLEASLTALVDGHMTQPA